MDSRYYKNESVLNLQEAMLHFTRKNLCEDGTVDLYLANYNSAPDAAFNLIFYAKAYNSVKSESFSPREQEVMDKLYELMDTLAEGVVINGFHTPNHRWIISAALALAYTITGKQKFRDRIDEYLIEGIDCNEDGEFAERSAGRYNSINGYALLILAEQLGKPEMLEYMERNLTMMYSYFEPDYSIFTGNSTRQDKGKKVYGELYFPLYLYLAAVKGTAGYAPAAAIYQTWTERHTPIAACIDYYMTYPEFRDYELDSLALPAWSGENFYRESGVVRIKEENYAVTLLENKPDFLHVVLKDIALFLRISVNFYNERHLIPQKIVKLAEGSYRLDYTAQGHYYLPYGEYQGTSDWWQMDRSKRERIKEMELQLTTYVERVESGIRVKITSSDFKNVPIKMQWNIQNAVRVYGDDFSMPYQNNTDVIVKKGNLTAKTQLEALTIQNMLSSHDYTDYLVGGLPPARDTMHFYSNFVTPFDHTFTILCE